MASKVAGRLRPSPGSATLNNRYLYADNDNLVSSQRYLISPMAWGCQ